MEFTLALEFTFSSQPSSFERQRKFFKTVKKITSLTNVCIYAIIFLIVGNEHM